MKNSVLFEGWLESSDEVFGNDFHDDYVGESCMVLENTFPQFGNTPVRVPVCYLISNMKIPEAARCGFRIHASHEKFTIEESEQYLAREVLGEFLGSRFYMTEYSGCKHKYEEIIVGNDIRYKGDCDDVIDILGTMKEPNQKLYIIMEVFYDDEQNT